MTYDGTITTPDPNLVETFALEDGRPAYIIRDVYADAPDWDGIGYVLQAGFSRRDGVAVVVSGDGDDTRGAEVMRDALAAALDHYGNDADMVTRYLRMWHDAAAVDYSDMIDRDSRHYAVVTGGHLAAWGITDADDAARGALAIVRQWAEGDVYGVVVPDGTGGDDSAWDVYDDTADLRYCRQVARELAGIVR